ncbi:GNAT family N-acetyltransferase [Microcoleus sp. Pol10D4]|uniref:GNAT family N-acetyltransferase n=1 Tax=Microcoleus sp. Pol10D4 TaxID=3055387 RepID=UPI004040C6C3
MFETLKLDRIYATCLRRNIASAKVLQKLGMTQEGSQKQRIFHRGQLEELELYSLLKKHKC